LGGGVTKPFTAVTRIIVRCRDLVGYVREMSFDPDALLAHLQPDNVRKVLSLAGLSLVANEMIESCIVHPVKGFYSWEFSKELEPVASERYRQVVLKEYKHEVDACLAWLVDAGALTKCEAATVHRVREVRNTLGHELTWLILDPKFQADYEALFEFADVVRRLGVFWARMSIDADEDYDGRDISDEDIGSGMSMVYGLVFGAFVEGFAECQNAGSDA
jgi:hypothetical protein